MQTALPAAAESANNTAPVNIPVQNAGLENTTGKSSFPCWRLGGYGNNTARLRATTTAHSGKRAALMTVTQLSSGNRKFLLDSGTPGCAIDVKPGDTYALSLWLRTHTTTQLSVYLQDSAGRWRWWAQSPREAARSTWHQKTLNTPSVPEWAQAMVYGVTALDVGRVFVDDASVSRTHRAAPVAPDVDDDPENTINVSDAQELRESLAKATPGQTIKLADGTYDGNFVLAESGTAQNPLTIKGSSKAVLRASSISSGYALHLDGVQHVRLSGFSVTGGQKGIVLDESSHSVLTGLDVSNTGSELVLLRNNSTHNTVSENTIHGAGRRTAAYGEGVYVGQSRWNWNSSSSRTGGGPDRSDNNIIENNRIYDTTAECVDIKEGTQNGVVRNNTFDGGSLTGANYADSWVDLAGNGYLISGNSGVRNGGVLRDGFQTHVQLDGWGSYNTFDDNHGSIDADGYGIYIHDLGTGNVVRRTNSFTGAKRGTSNIPVT